MKALLACAKGKQGEDEPNSSAVENAATSCDKTSSESTDEIVNEAVSILEIYYNLTANFTPNKIGLFLKKVKIPKQMRNW